MQTRSIKRHAFVWLTAATLLSLGSAAIAQMPAEPTMHQIYEAAQAGRIDQAQMMLQQVLVAHPNSAKAHFVQAELAVRQGQLARARDSLATAEKLAPGLPFAKGEAVQHLRDQLSGKATTPAARASSDRLATPAKAAPAPVAPSSPFPWGLALAGAAGVAGLGMLLLRRKQAAAAPMASRFASPSPAASPGMPPQPATGGLGGQQFFGNGNPAMPGGMPSAGSGIGGKVVGGLAAGLAVGAGVMAAQAIGKNLMGDNDHPQHPPAANPLAESTLAPGGGDLGGENFGISDTSSWDDGGAGGAVDDGDWDR